MKYKLTNDRLKIVIDELGDEYKDLLLMKVMDQSGIINPDEIEIPELLRLDMREKESLKTDKRTWQKKKMVGAISLVGLLYALIGLILLMFSQTKELHSYNIEIFALIVSFMGLFVTLYTYIFNIFLKLRKTNKNQMITEYDVICKWKEFEIVCENYSGRIGTVSRHKIMSELKSDGILCDEDIKKLDELRVARNNIVHKSEGIRQSNNELNKILVQANSVIKKLQDSCIQ